MNGWDVVANVTVQVVGDDSMMFQIPGTSIAEFQSDVSGIPSLEFRIRGTPEEEILDLQKNLIESGLEYDAVVTGAIRSDYQKTRIERMCHELEKISFAPLWHNNPRSHLEELYAHGFEVLISSVSCEGLGKEWLGKKIDSKSLTELNYLSQEYGFNMDGEGGEYETIVVNAPHFENRIEFEGDTHWDGVRGHIIFRNFSISD